MIPTDDRPRLYFWLNAACLILITGVGLYSMEVADYRFAGDDAFISFVYASNAASGDGLVFNTGEYVWGFTSPLQTLLLGGFAFLGLDLVYLAPRLTLLWVGLTSLVVFQILRRFLPGPLCLLASIYLATAHSSVSALETKLLVLLQCAFLLLLISARARSAALVGALACLTRPDSVLLVVPGLAMTRATRNLPCLAAFALPGLLWVSFAYLYYGDVLPNSLDAKQGLSGFSSYLAHNFRQFTNIGLPEELPRLASAGLFVSLCLCVLLAPRLRASRPLVYSLLVYPWLLLLAYAAIGSVKFHEWEIHSGLIFSRLAALLGLFSVAALGARRWPAARVGIFVATAALVLTVSYSSAARFLDSLERSREHRALGVRHETYRRISDWINLNVPVSSSLSVLEVGTIGYYTQVHLIDVAGIVTRGYSADERLDHVRFARRFEPDYMLLNDDVAGLRVGPGLFYERVRYFPEDGFADFSLLKRR